LELYTRIVYLLVIVQNKNLFVAVFRLKMLQKDIMNET